MEVGLLPASPILYLCLRELETWGLARELQRSHLVPGSFGEGAEETWARAGCFKGILFGQEVSCEKGGRSLPVVPRRVSGFDYVFQQRN